MTKKRGFLISIFLTLIVLMAVCFSIVGCGNKSSEEDKYVAKIGTDYYTTLEKAIGDVEGDDVITLVSNVTLTSSITIPYDITLDLGGYTITATGIESLICFEDGVSSSSKYRALTGYTLTTTIKNGTIISDRPQIIYVGKCNYITAENLNLVCTADVTEYNGKAVVSFDCFEYEDDVVTGLAEVDSTFEFLSGSITTNAFENSCGIYGIESFGTCTVYLGDYTTGDGPTIKSSLACVAVNDLDSNTATLEIYGGSYELNIGDDSYENAQCDAVIYISTDAVITICGGELKNTSLVENSSVISVPYTLAVVNLTISAGEFSSKYVVFYIGTETGTSGSDTDNNSDVITITGGSFTEKTPEAGNETSFSSYIDSSCEATASENQDGYTSYIVEEKTAD